MIEQKTVLNDRILSTEQPIKFEEAREFLGNISKTSMHKLLKQGKIKGYRILRQWRFFKSELTNQVKQL